MLPMASFQECVYFACYFLVALQQNTCNKSSVDVKSCLHKLLNATKDRYEFSDEATLTVVKETNTREAIKQTNPNSNSALSFTGCMTCFLTFLSLCPLYTMDQLLLFLILLFCLPNVLPSWSFSACILDLHAFQTCMHARPCLLKCGIQR